MNSSEYRQNRICAGATAMHTACLGPARQPIGLERDEFRMNRHRALAYCLSMISAQTLRVCREGKPVSTFPDHAPEGTVYSAFSPRTSRGVFPYWRRKRP